MRVIFLVILLSSFLVKGNAQETNSEQKEFVQFIMTNLPSKEKAIEINNHFNAQTGVFMARADLNSKKFLVLYYSNSTISPEQILTWMDELDITYKCVRQGIHGTNVILDQKMDCE